MKKIKIAAIISLAILLSISFISCDSSTEKKENAVKETTKEETKTESKAEEKESTEVVEKEQENREEYVIKKGEVLPDIEFNLIDGSTIKLSDYKDKIVLLNFWTTWWPYCKKELPSLNRINERDDVVVIAVDVNESKETLTKFLESNEITTNLALDGDGKLAQMFLVGSFPTTYFIDEENILIGFIPTMVDDKMLEELITKIKNKEIE